MAASLKALAAWTFIVAACLGVPFSAAAEIPEVEWSRLTDQDTSPQGRAALALQPHAWKHAESEHFVYHFTNPEQAETVFVHAEHYYQWIKNFLGIQTDRWKKKSHIFIFDDQTVWTEFNRRVRPSLFEAGGFTNGWELYLFRSAFWLAPKKTLAHELTHLVLFRFLEGPIPLFLDEGFAELVSFRALATEFGGDEYAIRTIPRLKPGEWVPLKALTGQVSYPARTQDVEAFYKESEWLARFLAFEFERGKFYQFLHEVSQGRAVESVLKVVYGLDLEALERRFKAFAGAS